MMKSNSLNYTGLEIAIIGMANRLPGANNWRQYWDNLSKGVESIHFFSDEELRERGVDTFKIKDPEYVKAGGVLRGKEFFDSSFFEFRPDEARLMNPLHRVFYECVWEALEDAGCNPDKTKGSIGLYAGAGYDIVWKVYSTIMNIDQAMGNFFLNFINNKDYLTSLVSYKLNLKGSVYNIETACSTSLVAVHVACRSLLLGEVRVALAGSVSLKSRKVSGYYPVKGGISSRDGHCRAFDVDSDGIVESEGAGIVVLKRLKDAQADGDHIYAVIKGSATNNDGIRKVGYTAPSVEGQSECIKMALRFSKVEPESISYIETHGTGTKIGDPIEIAALNTAFGKKPGHTCAIGSVKTNLGHTDTTAGVAGLIKTVLSLKYKKLLPSLHFKVPNPEINFEGGPFFVNTELKQWNRVNNIPLRAGVSSFGIGGTNAHVIVEEAQEEELTDAGRKYKLLCLSAKTEASLLRYAGILTNFLKENPDTQLGDMSYSLQVGRKHFAYCQSFVYTDLTELIGRLESADLGGSTIKRNESVKSLLFIFPDAESFDAKAYADLYEQEKIFREEMDKGFSILKELSTRDYNVIYENGFNEPTVNDKLNIQPLVFIFELALAKLMISWGINPSYVMGHGVGEYVAASVSNVIEPKDALKLILTQAGWDNENNTENPQEVNSTEFSHLFGSMKIVSPQIPIISNMSGEIVAFENLRSSDYWIQKAKCLPASLTGILNVIEHEKDIIFVEVGAGHRWTTFISDNINTKTTPAIHLGLDDTPERAAMHQIIQQTGLLWSYGVDVDWHSYYKEETRRKIPLPTYAFEKIEYPVEYNLTDVFRDKGGLLVGKLESLSDWFHRAQWKQSAWLRKEVSTLYDGGTLLIFSSSGTLSDNVITEYSVQGDSVMIVEMGTEFKKVHDHHYIINPAHKRDYKLLFEDLTEERRKVTRIIHLWNYDEAVRDNDDATALVHHHQVRGYDSILEIVRNHASASNLLPLKLDMVYNGLFNVLGTENLVPEKNLSVGPIKVIPLEFPNIASRIIDLTDTSQDSMFALSKELTYDTEDREIAIRGRSRYTKDFENINGDLPDNFTPFKQGGTYLITGANGGMGKLFSNYLATFYKANLILVARHERPDAYIETLETKGSVVFYIEADVIDADKIKAGVSEAEKIFPGINGVIHTAGVADHAGVIIRRTESEDQSILGPKVLGTKIVFSIFEDKPLDFFVNCSSVSSSLPVFGQVAYIAANAYLDAFAELKGRHYPVVSIAWCGLNDIGMSTNPAIKLNVQESEYSLKPEEVIEILIRCLYFGLPTPIISKVDFKYFLKHYLSQFGSNNDFKDVTAVLHPRPLLSVAYAAPETAMEIKISEILKTFFGLTSVGVNDDFFELGGDSLTTLIVCKRIHEATHVEISMGSFFQDPTIKGLARIVEDTLAPEGVGVKSIVI